MDTPETPGSTIEEFETSGPRPPSAGDTIAVLLHGRGSDKNDLQGLRRLVPDTWTLVTPRAVHAGAPWGYGPGWAWYRYLEDDRVDPATLDASLSALDHFLDALPRHLGGPVDRIVLGGFSQGGTTSLAYALSRPERVRAVLNFSGFLAGGVSLDNVAEAPPIFWGHGLHDPAIPHALAVRGRAALADAGATLTTADPAIGHGIVPEEVEAAVAMVEDVNGRARPPRTR
ncbi:MAG: alpha/beta hydrolase-fold protein [Gemmatimonadota bacterium]|nr:alpha/beta hydrolase-fold protein [Gemmatimonadota bacterium]